MESKSEMNASRQGLRTQPAPHQTLLASRFLTIAGYRAIQLGSHLLSGSRLVVSVSLDALRINEDDRCWEPVRVSDQALSAVYRLLTVIRLLASSHFTSCRSAGWRCPQIHSIFLLLSRPGQPNRRSPADLALFRPMCVQTRAVGRRCRVVSGVKCNGLAGAGLLTTNSLLWKGAAG